jgi:phage tail-like protein
MTDEFAFLGTTTSDEWDEWHFENTLNDAGSVRLRRERLPAYIEPRTLLELDQDESPVTDIDVDDCGILYLLHESGHVARYNENTGGLDRIGCGAIEPSWSGRALTVASKTIYVATEYPALTPDSDAETASGDPETNSSDTQPSGSITAVARHIEQKRWHTSLADGVPVAMADEGERIFVLCESPDGGFLATVAPDGEIARVMTGFEGVQDIAIDADGTAFLLGDNADLRRFDVKALDPAQPADAPARWNAAVPADASCLTAGERDELLVGERGAAVGAVTLSRVSATAREAIAGCTRNLDRLHLADDLYAVEAGGRQVFALSPRQRFARQESTGEHDGWVANSFDSGEEATTWHRVTLGFSVRDTDTQVRLGYAATDDPIQVGNVDWRWIEPANPHDALLEDAVGRYLWLRIDLQGARFSSPQLRTVRAYFPQQSYLRYLPAIYQDDEESSAFLRQFLSLFESEFVGIEEDIGRMTQYFDSTGVPPAFLDWLGEWLAVDPDETWPASGHRKLLSRAPALYRGRGTPNGLLELLQIYLTHAGTPSPAWEEIRERQLAAVDDREELSPDDARALRRRINSDVFLLEYSDLDCATGPSRRAYERLLDCPQCFFVFVRPFVSDAQFETIQRLVDDNRPAHAVGRAVELEQSIVLGGHAYLGINSTLPSRELVVGDSSLGRDSTLETRQDAGQLGVRAILGDDTELS